MNKKLKLLLLLLTLCVGQALAQESNLALFFCGVNVPKGHCENGRQNLVPHINKDLLSKAPHVHQPNNPNSHATVWDNFVNDYGIYYAPDTKKLTLKNIRLEVGYDGMSHVIKAYGSNGQLNMTQNLELCLEGENEITIYYESSGLLYFFRDNVKLSGSGSLKVNMRAERTAQPLIAVGGDLTTDSGFTGSVSFSACNNSGGYIAHNVTVKDDYMILANGWSGATIGQEDEKNVLPGHSYDFTYDTHDYRFLGVAPAKKFDLYIANKQVDYTNMTDVFGDGTVSYDRASKTLILNNATIDCPNVTTDDNAVISTKGYWFTIQNTEPVVKDLGASLKVKLVGDNVINGNAEIGFENSVGLSGSGNLTMNISNSGDAYGFGAYSYLESDFSGWVSVNTNPGESGTGKAVEHGRINLPSNTGYFASAGDDYDHLTSININSTTVSGLDKRYAVFGAESAINNDIPQIYLHPTNSDNPLTKVAYVGKTISAKQCFVRANGGQAPYRYSSSTLPAGLTIDPNTGIISGTYSEVITAADIEARPYIILKVTDRLGHYNEVTEELREVKPAMTLTDDPSLDLPDMLCRQAITPIACGPFKTNGVNWKFSAVGLPEGITIAEHTGIISGTPTVVNNQPSVATITVTDELGQKASIEINVGRVFENYEFHVAGTLITSANMDNISVDGQTSGTISYDPETETLTFNNVRINNTAASTSYFVDSKISKINVVGDNRITYTGTVSGASKYYGFPGNLDIYGNGKFNFRSGRLGENSIAVKGDVTIKDDATILLSSYTGAINGTLSVPMNQVIYTANTTSLSVADNQWEMLYNEEEDVNDVEMKYVKTERLEKGALRFAEDFHLPEFLISIPTRINLADYVSGGVAPYSYNVTGLPQGIQFKNDGLIWGTPNPTTEAVSNVTITVTDAMGRSITMTERLTVVHPDINYHIYGGNAAVVSGVAHDWYEIENMKLGGANRLMYVDFPWDTNQDLNTNVIARDADGNWWAKEIELTDGVPYAAPYEVNAENIYYTRKFSISVWQALCVPFSINVEDYIDQFDIAELFAFCPLEDTNGNGIVDAYDDNMLIVATKKTGMTTPNVPYVIRPKEAKTYTIISNNSTLADCKAGQVTFSTSQKNFKVVGILSEPITADTDNGYYYMSSGALNHRTTGSTTLKPNKWYMEISGRSYGDVGVNLSAEGPAMIKVKAIGEDFDEETAIRMVNGDFDATNTNTGIYNLNGMKMNDTEKLPRGIYIMNGKKVIIK